MTTRYKYKWMREYAARYGPPGCLNCGIGLHAHARGQKCPREAYITPRPDWPTRHQPEPGQWVPCECAKGVTVGA